MLPTPSVAPDNNKESFSTAATTMTTKTIRTNIIPETLLAFSKDIRYTNIGKEYIIKLLQSHATHFGHIFSTKTTLAATKTYIKRDRSFSSSSHVPNDSNQQLPLNSSVDHDENDLGDDKKQHPLIEPVAELIIQLLYSVLVIRNLNRTLGMELFGLQYNTNHNDKTTSSSSKNLTLLSCSSKNALRSAVVSIWMFTIRYLSYRLSKTMNKSNDDSEDERQAAGRNQLSNDKMNNRTNVERLTGKERLQYFEQQRRRMINRATSNSDSKTSSNHDPLYSSSPAGITESFMQHSINPSIKDRYKRIYSIACQLIHGLELALKNDVLLTDGPHGIENYARNNDMRSNRMNTTLLPETAIPSTEYRTVNADSDFQNNNTVVQTSNANNVQNVASFVFTWLIRFHFAMYCLDGKYPTIAHRLLYSLKSCNKHHHPNNSAASHDENHGTIIASSSPIIRLVQPPTTVPKLIGTIIMLQSIVTAIESITTYVVHMLVDTHTKSSFNVQRTIQYTTSFPISGITKDDYRRRNLKHSRTTSAATRLRGGDATGAKRTIHTTTCAICRSPRQYPACPKSCGHVFCWYCLHRWITCTVPACPVCRTPCTSKDVLALYDYE